MPDKPITRQTFAMPQLTDKPALGPSRAMPEMAGIIAEWKTLNSKRTGGEWFDYNNGKLVTIIPNDGKYYVPYTAIDVAFIVSAANHMTAVLEHIEELERQLEGWNNTQ